MPCFSAFGAQIYDTIDNSHVTLVGVDCSGVTFIDSAGVRMLLDAVARSRRNLLMRPRTMRHRLRQQIVIAKAITDHFFQCLRLFQCGWFHG